MAKIVYALFASEEPAQEAVTTLGRRTPERPNFPVQRHRETPLDGNFLPESATEIGRNTMVAMGFGGGVGLALGIIAGAGLDIMGLTVGLGAGLGMMTGVLMGLLGGMMAGTRVPKAALREAAEGLGEAAEGCVLVTVEVEDRAHVGVVEDIVDALDPVLSGVC